MRSIRQQETSETAEERLNLRVAPNVKNLITRAAVLQGRTTTDFVTAAAYQAAQQTIEFENLMKLNERDSERIQAMLANPPKPTKALRKFLGL